MTYNTQLVADLRTYGHTNTVEDNDRLYALALTGDKAARERLIVGNLPRVITLVQRFLYTHFNATYLEDDLYSEGFTATVEAVNTLIALAKPNPDPGNYIHHAVCLRITRSVDAAPLVHPAQASARTKRHNGDPLPSIHSLPDTLYADADTTCELRDLIESCCTAAIDSSILDMREAGMTFKEIASAFNLSRSGVNDRFRAVRRRFDEKMKKLRE